MGLSFRSDPPKETFFFDDKRDRLADRQGCSRHWPGFLDCHHCFALHSCSPCAGGLCGQRAEGPRALERGREEREEGGERAQGGQPPQRCQRVRYAAVIPAATASSRTVCSRSVRIWCRRAAVRSAMPASRLRTSRRSVMLACVSTGKVRNSSWRKRVCSSAGMARHRRMRYWIPACFRPLCTKR